MPGEITGVIIARNEQADLPDCLGSWEELCARIILVDDGSTDDTAEIASFFGCDVIPSGMTHHEGFSGLRNVGLEKVDTEMALVFDADERPTEQLVDAIRARGSDDGHAYRIARRTYAFGRWLDYGQFSDDSPVRLFSSDTRYSGIVHEKPVIAEGTKVVDLDGYIEHFTYASVGEYIQKMRCYAKLQGREADTIRRSVKYWYLRPAYNFFYRQGYRDGARGLALAIGEGWYDHMTGKNAKAN